MLINRVCYLIYSHCFIIRSTEHIYNFIHALLYYCLLVAVHFIMKIRKKIWRYGGLL